MNAIKETNRDKDLQTRVKELTDAAYRVRMGVLDEGEAQGEGYVGQALGAADIMAALYGDAMRYQPGDPDWEDRDRLLMSVGHYALLLYAGLAEAGVIPFDELGTYAADDSRLPMSAMSTYTPGVEISGGSLGHGLGLGVGTALGLRHQGKTDQKVFVLSSDGELDEGSTWEAAMSASNWQTGNLIALVDMNGMQADGRTADVLSIDTASQAKAQEHRWESFGWHAQRVDGNDLEALLTALDAATDEASAQGRPHIIICDTKLGKGVPMLESREKLHFMKIAAEEWPVCKQQLTDGYEGKDAR